MKKLDRRQVLRAMCYVASVIITIAYVTDVEGTEFSGGYLTGSLLSMAMDGALLFILALILGFWYVRLAATLGLLSSLLCLPIHFYFVAPVPFAELFAPGHEFMVQPSAEFHWQKWVLLTIA